MITCSVCCVVSAVTVNFLERETKGQPLEDFVTEEKGEVSEKTPLVINGRYPDRSQLNVDAEGNVWEEASNASRTDSYLTTPGPTPRPPSERGPLSARGKTSA